MAEPLGIALLGCGNVGAAVAKLLLEQPQRFAERAGRPLDLRHVVVRDPRRPRAVNLPAAVITTRLQHVLEDPAVHVVVELVGGTGWAKEAVQAALTAGKHVVTANKALLAEHGLEIYESARAAGRAVAFEAAVAGGIPIIAALSECLAANQIVSLQGILNGTSNFILTSMSESGRSYSAALAEAQRRGYAEADPTLDVDGSDAAHKLAILAQLAFGTAVPMSAISRRGVAEIHEMDIRFAAELGHTIKLLAEAWLSSGLLALQVAPVLMRRTLPLAQVRGSFNAIQVFGDVVGETLFYGPGAGAMPTASSVLADIIDLAVGRAQRTFETLKLWALKSAPIRPSDSVRSRFYMRLLVEDRPGVLADITRALADEQISISSVIQHEALDEHEGDVVPLVILTHTAPTGRFRAAFDRINRLACSTSPGVYYSVAD